MSSHGSSGGSGHHTRPGVGSGHTSSFSSSGHSGSSSGSSGWGGNTNVGHTPSNNNYGHGSNYGHNNYGSNHNNHYNNHHNSYYNNHHYNNHNSNYAGTTYGGGHLGHNYGHSSSGGYRRSSSGCIGFLAILIVVMVIVGIVVAGGILPKITQNITNSTNAISNNSSVSTSASTTVTNLIPSDTLRERLETGHEYISDCVDDNVGWFDNEPKLESQLKYFWERTGIQPYILIKEYDASLATVADKEAWAEDYYMNYLNDDVFMYVYFDENPENSDYFDTIGYMYQVNSDTVGTIMDSEAAGFFWDYLDGYWYDDSLNTDTVFIKTFKATADSMMYASDAAIAQAAEQAKIEAAEQAKQEAAIKRNKIIKRVLTIILIVVGAIILLAGVLIAVAIILYNKQKKREEDERILNTPLSDMVDDDLVKKYLGEEENSDKNSEENSDNKSVENTPVSPHRHPLDEKSTVSMSASTRGAAHSTMTASERINKHE